MLPGGYDKCHSRSPHGLGCQGHAPTVLVASTSKARRTGAAKPFLAGVSDTDDIPANAASYSGVRPRTTMTLLPPFDNLRSRLVAGAILFRLLQRDMRSRRRTAFLVEASCTCPPYRSHAPLTAREVRSAEPGEHILFSGFPSETHQGRNAMRPRGVTSRLGDRKLSPTDRFA